MVVVVETVFGLIGFAWGFVVVLMFLFSFGRVRCCCAAFGRFFGLGVFRVGVCGFFTFCFCGFRGSGFR